MYSPKIAEDLIPLLYEIRKQKKIPMTKIVDEILRKALRTQRGDVPPRGGDEEQPP